MRNFKIKKDWNEIQNEKRQEKFREEMKMNEIQLAEINKRWSQTHNINARKDGSGYPKK